MANLLIMNGKKAGSAFGMKQRKPKPEPLPRDEQILLMRGKGMPYSRIAKQFNLSIPRIAQICNKAKPVGP